jgi:transcriptional regulator with PAS, ATPase and Fis domain
LPENLLESELFGHEKGAFTGADRVIRGQLELAHTGTLFLDEIGELSYALQAKLLRTLQEREFRRLGSEHHILVDIRVISATSRDLRTEIAAKSFRQELYYRLNAVTVNLPPLRDRKNDIPILAHHFLEHFCRECGLTWLDVSPEVRKLFLDYAWPGNVRELENTVERVVLFSRGGVIDVSDLPPAFHGTPPGLGDRLFIGLPPLEEIERRYLLHVLESVGGNRTKAAEVMGIDRRTLYRMAERFGLDLKDEG